MGTYVRAGDLKLHVSLENNSLCKDLHRHFPVLANQLCEQEVRKCIIGSCLAELTARLSMYVRMCVNHYHKDIIRNDA